MRGGIARRGSSLTLAAALACAQLAGCGDKDEPKQEGSSTAAAATSSAGPTATAASEAKPQAVGKLPDQVADLFAAVPESATLVARAPGLADLGLPKETVDALLPLVLKEAAEGTQLSEALLRSLVEAYDGMAFFSLGDDLDAKPPPFAIVGRFKDGKVVEQLITELKLEKTAEGRYKLAKDGKDTYVAWLASAGVVIVSPSEPTLTAALDTLGGKGSSFVGAPVAKGAGPLFAFGDLHRLAKRPELFALGSLVALSYGGGASELSYRMFGDKVPRLSQVLAATPHDALAKLPDKPLFAVDISLARAPGKTLANVLAEVGRATGADPTPEAEKTLKQVGLSLADLDRALGPSLTIGSYAPAGLTDPAKLGEQTTSLFVLPILDDSVPKKLFDTAKAATGGEKGLKFGPGKVTVELPDKKSVLIELSPGAVVVAYGEPKLADKLVSTFKSGKGVLGESASYASYKASAAPSLLTFYVDYDQALATLPKDLPFKVPFSGASGSDLLINPSDNGLDLTLKGGTAVPLMGTMGALAIYGVRRYLASAKTSEAKNTIGAITRGAMAAYERETLGGAGSTHQLCKSTPRTPAAVPTGKKYQPDSTPGSDFESGDATSGWKCLKFTVTSPVYYSYEYRQGGPYKCPARGGVDPGPDGFEVSAEGDLDGDGVTSLFCQTGKIDPATKSVKVGTQLFIADEYE